MKALQQQLLLYKFLLLSPTIFQILKRLKENNITKIFRVPISPEMMPLLRHRVREITSKIFPNPNDCFDMEIASDEIFANINNANDNNSREVNIISFYNKDLDAFFLMFIDENTCHVPTFKNTDLACLPECNNNSDCGRGTFIIQQCTNYFERFRNPIYNLNIALIGKKLHQTAGSQQFLIL